MTNSIIITCNAGSTNSKLAVFDAESLAETAHLQTHTEAETVAWLCAVSSVMTKEISPLPARGRVREGVKNRIEDEGVSLSEFNPLMRTPTPPSPLQGEGEERKITAIGHRVVHGGGKFTAPTLLTSEIIHELEQFIPLAPLHQPAALKLIAEVARLYPDVPQIACFDTAFHHTMPEIETRLALPQSFYNEGVRRYGFHGLSYEYIASVLPENIANGRVIVAHLGGGSSACAMRNRKSIASTMGFSTLDGLMMGTRCGALDAGVVLHLMQHKNMSADDVEKLLYKNSGLLGVSGISGEMRELLASNKPEAKAAIELYCYLAAKQLAGLIPALGGLDALVFTGGIGEHAQPVRDKICEHLCFMENFSTHTIPTNEELVIARACKNYK